MKKTEKQAKVLVLIPTAGRVEKETTRSLDRQTYKNFETVVNVQPPVVTTGWKLFDTYFNCTHNMNQLRETALKSDADFFLCLDSDVVLPPTALEELVLQNKAVMGGWYRMVNSPYYTAGVFVAHGGPGESGILVNWTEVQRDVVRAHFVGHGCMLLQRKVLEAVSFRHGCDEMALRYNGPDRQAQPMAMGACGVWGLDCQRAGFELFMTSRVHCGHKDRTTGKIVK